MTAALITAASLIVVAVIGTIGLFIRQKFKTTNDRRKTLQTNRTRAAQRFRPLMAEIIASDDAIRSRAVRLDRNLANDLDALTSHFASYFSRLNAEPDCKPLADSLVTILDKIKQYAFIEQQQYVALRTTNQQAIKNTSDALDTAWAELRTALTTLTDGLHEHMKILDTPVG